MSKAFVIKNKEGKYFVADDIFGENILNAYLWVKERYAKMHIGYNHFKDCEVVEITITEVDNSKKEYNETKEYVDMLNKEIYELQNENLKQQLADKDVKIEVLERDISNLERTMEEGREQLKIALEDFNEIQEENDTLEQQLAEKDKEIAELRKKCKELSDKEFEHFGDMKTYKNMWLAEQRKNKEIRHQVCEEIKNLAGNYFDMPICENCGEQIVLNDVVLTGNDLIEILDQIEQGDE